MFRIHSPAVQRNVFLVHVCQRTFDSKVPLNGIHLQHDHRNHSRVSCSQVKKFSLECNYSCNLNQGACVTKSNFNSTRKYFIHLDIHSSFSSFMTEEDDF